MVSGSNFIFDVPFHWFTWYHLKIGRHGESLFYLIWQMSEVAMIGLQQFTP